ncbi:MAG: acyl--CoA ligase [Ignavibacteriae bacterium]|nr:acyl--CoA ligase [Ignavibacteriota bacterium]
MADSSLSLQEKILQAQSVGGVPPTELLVPFGNIGSLLQARAEEFDAAPFLIYYADDGSRKEYSFRELYEEACKTANLLHASGIRRGDRIATVSQNHSDTVIHYFAAFLLGAVVVPVNVGEEDERIAYILQNSETKLAFVRDQYIDRIKSIQHKVPTLKEIYQCGRIVDTSLPHFDSAVRELSTRFKPTTTPEPTDEALIVYTSGTTGLPKGVVLVQYNLLVDAMAIAEWHRIASDQRMMCVLPIHHVNGTVVTLVTPLYAGCGVVLNQKFHPDKFFERIGIERVSVVSVVPTLLQFLLHAKIDFEAYKLQHLRHIICGAGPLTVELAMKFEQKFKIPIIHGYGLSETTCYSCFLPIDLSPQEHRVWLSKYGYPSIGVPIPVNEMAIHDEQGNELPEGEKGEIVIRGHNVMKHYFQNEESNQKTFAHNWFRSGDEGFFRYDEQLRKFFFITGRIKELIIRGGVNISPFEIDEVLMNMPGIHAGIAVGFENDWYGEEVGAYVTMKDGFEVAEQDVIAYCRKHLPFSKTPKAVVFSNHLPVTSTGKYQRSKCKPLFEPWKEVQFTEKRS